VKRAEITERTLKIMRGFPKQARIDLGMELRRVQEGLNPAGWKPMSSIGKGVREIRVKYRGEYRLIYTATLGDTVYVLHAFRKKTKRTTKADVEIAKARLKEARQVERDRRT
jgi:phage-related protein